MAEPTLIKLQKVTNVEIQLLLFNENVTIVGGLKA